MCVLLESDPGLAATLAADLELQALRGRRDFQELLKKHPPRPEDVEDGLDMNPETMGPELLAAAYKDPEMSLSDAEAIWDEWDDAVVTQLFLTAYNVNKEVRDVPFVNTNSGRTPSSERRSGSPGDTGSPDPSS